MEKTKYYIMSTNKKIAIIGLGYVGLPLAVEFGKNRITIGYDINQSRIEELKSGNDSTLEVSSSDLQNSNYLSFTSDSNLLNDCQIYIITVPTPIDSAKRPNLNSIIKASEMVAKSLKKVILLFMNQLFFLDAQMRFVFQFLRVI